MILYLDTSALVKLYVKEPGSKAVRVLLERAHVVSTSRVAYVEMRADLPESSGKAS
jgi:predicted nucleic acid-binding protein